MTKHNQDFDQSFLDQLASEYKKVSVEEPSVDIDKQIIAAAHREIANPNKLKRPNNGWWRRLSLPVYAAATFAFTAIATHLLLPEPVGVPPGTMSKPIQIDVSEEPVIEVEMPMRKPKKLPEYHAPTAQPSAIVKSDLADNHLAVQKVSGDTESVEKATGVESSNSGASEFATERKVDSIHSAKLNVLEKEKWARQIIELLKNGEAEKAQKELVRFKKSYPDYPIDTQIAALKLM